MKSLIFAGAALLASTNAWAQSPEDWIVLRQLAASVMRVQAIVDDKASNASGVALTSHLAVTNCHVVGNSLHAALMRGSLSAPATLKVRDAIRDVCLLSVDASPAFTPDIGRAETLKLGDTVYAVGFGVGRLTTSVGQVEALYPYEGSVVVRTSAAFPMGASGGALFDRNKRLVGILTFYRHGHETQAYYALPIEWATQLATSTQTLDNAHASPFWAVPADMQPWFLQAAGYETDGEWGKMLNVTQRWLAAEPGNAEAKRALEFARSKLP
jgi:S1-C subfamily serine protease